MNVKKMTTEELKTQKEHIETFWLGFSGNHIPVQYMAKVGAVLNQKNRDRLEQIKALAQQVLDSAEHEPQKIEELELSLERIQEIINDTITSVIRKAQGKLN